MSQAFEVTLRRDTSGGGVVHEPRGTKTAFRARYRAILLVHGYNVSEDEAVTGFDTFATYLAKLEPRLISDLGMVFWPGDWRTPLVRDAAYPWKIATARECALQMADYLEGLSDPQGRPAELVIVAHSLGCRLALESLRVLFKRSGERRVTLILMAAAVPVPWVTQEIQWLTRQTNLRILVLFSSADKVLRTGFPVGQRLAEPHFGRFQQAVGRFGNPPTGVWWRAQEMTGYGHGDYWISRSIPRILCLLMARVAARELITRELHGWELVEYDGVESRMSPARRFAR